MHVAVASSLDVWVCQKEMTKKCLKNAFSAPLQLNKIRSVYQRIIFVFGVPTSVEGGGGDEATGQRPVGTKSQNMLRIFSRLPFLWVDIIYYIFRRKVINSLFWWRLQKNWFCWFCICWFFSFFVFVFVCKGFFFWKDKSIAVSQLLHAFQFSYIGSQAFLGQSNKWVGWDRMEISRKICPKYLLKQI